MKINIKNKKKWGWIALGIIVVIFLAFNAESIGQKFGVVPGGNISLTVPVSGSTVFMDGKRLQVTDSKNKTVLIKDLSVKKPHVIIVSKEGYWPWTKTLSVKSEKTLEVNAFTSPAGQQVTTLTPANPEYAQALTALKRAGAPTKNKMIVSKSLNVGIWVEGNNLNAIWLPKSNPDDFFCREDLCNDEGRVFKSTARITSISFYKNRDDVILFASGGSIFAIEIDQKGTQNFQPVYEGINTIFTPANDDFLYIQDSGKILKLLL